MLGSNPLLPSTRESELMDVGWRDIEGQLYPKGSGVGTPTLGTFRDDIRWFWYKLADDGDAMYHMPHDYALGTDIYIHVHWAHNGTVISGQMDLRAHLTYAKGHNQENFIADKELHIIVPTPNIATIPQYRHRVDEIQISNHGGTGGLLDSRLLEPDGLLLAHYDLDEIPVITSAAPGPFIFHIDIHYQANRYHTPQKSPNFYTPNP